VRPAQAPVWVVNPEVHRRFEARAQKEAARRLEAQQTIREVVATYQNTRWVPRVPCAREMDAPLSLVTSLLIPTLHDLRFTIFTTRSASLASASPFSAW
jgi:hypothetical protein